MQRRLRAVGRRLATLLVAVGLAAGSLPQANAKACTPGDCQCAVGCKCCHAAAKSAAHGLRGCCQRKANSTRHVCHCGQAPSSPALPTNESPSPRQDTRSPLGLCAPAGIGLAADDAADRSFVAAVNPSPATLAGIELHRKLCVWQV